MDALHFTSLLIYERHKRLAKEAYSKFPDKIKERIAEKFIHTTDMFDKSINPTKIVNNETLGFYIQGTSIIYITPKHGVYSDECFRGLIAHETAHAIDYHTPFFQKKLRKIIYKIKYKLSDKSIKNLYSSSNLPVDELIADSLAKKWGFQDEITIMVKETRR